MNLLSPLNLLWLLAIAPIILLYLLKLRRREVRVSSVMFWQRAIHDLQANAPFQKLRRNLLLLLQILIVIALTLALARPFLKVHALGGKTVVVILDGSASMKTRERYGTRFDRAREVALRMVQDMARGDELMVILATHRARVLSPLSSSKRELIRRLKAAQPADTTTNLKDALQLAASLVRGRPESVIYLLSDGALPEDTDIRLGSANVQYLAIGETTDNVALTALDARRGLGARADWQVFLTVQNHRDQEVTAHLELYRDGVLFDLRPITVPARGEKSDLLRDLGVESGLLGVKLDVDDALAADNEAYVSLGARVQRNVLLVGKSSTFLEKALSIDPTIDLAKTSLAGYVSRVESAEGGSRDFRTPEGRDFRTPEGGSRDFRTPEGGSRDFRTPEGGGGELAQYDVIIFNGQAPPTLPSPPKLGGTEGGPSGGGAGGGGQTGNYVFIDCTGPECPARIIGEVRQPAILDWSREHPVTAYLDLSTVRLAKARRVEALTWGDVVVEAEDTPLVIAGEKGDSRSVFIGFDLGESNLPLRVAFPILVSNLVNWLTARQSGQGLQSVRTGEPVTVQLDGDALRATFEGPGRRRETFDVTQNPLILTDLDRVGTYTLRAGEETHHFAASLLSAAESDLTPRDRLTFGPQRVAAAQKGTTRNREFWRYLALLGLVVLAGEWWLYHRRG